MFDRDHNRREKNSSHNHTPVCRLQGEAEGAVAESEEEMLQMYAC